MGPGRSCSGWAGLAAVLAAACWCVACVECCAGEPESRKIVLIGHAGHDEVIGTTGQAPDRTTLVQTVADAAALRLEPDEQGVILTQTTLSQDDTREIMDELLRRFPDRLELPPSEDICYATQNRQNAVRAMAREVDAVIVVGARNSSNSARLREVAAQSGTAAHLVQDAREIEPGWLAGVRRIGITAGASTPEVLVRQVCDRLRALGAADVRSLEGARENVVFKLPLALLRRPATA